MRDMEKQIKARIEAFIRDISELARKAVDGRLAKPGKLSRKARSADAQSGRQARSKGTKRRNTDTASVKSSGRARKGAPKATARTGAAKKAKSSARTKAKSTRPAAKTRAKGAAKKAAKNNDRTISRRQSRSQSPAKASARGRRKST